MKQKLLLLIVLFLSVNSLKASGLEARLGWPSPQRYSFAVTGVIDEVSVHTGQKVDKGQLLARLDARPFKYHVKQCEAKISQLEPRLFDARLALNHAEELFERTVLSEVELQKIDGDHKALQAESDSLKAECQLQKWRAGKSSLKAEKDAYVLSSNLVDGMIISEENQSEVFVELVTAGQATALASLSSEQKSQLKSSDTVRITVDGKLYEARLQSLTLQPDAQGRYTAVWHFEYPGVVEAGKSIRVEL